MKVVRYLKRRQYLSKIGWYRNVLGDFVSSHGEMIVCWIDVYKMSDIEFRGLCPYFES